MNSHESVDSIPIHTSPATAAVMMLLLADQIIDAAHALIRWYQLENESMLI